MAELPTVDLMHATQIAKPFHREGWVYEEKYDGWRVVANKDADRVRLVSRNGHDLTRRFPELVINLKTAKALGLTIPQPLLLRADQVIE